LISFAIKPFANATPELEFEHCHACELIKLPSLAEIQLMLPAELMILPSELRMMEPK